MENKLRDYLKKVLENKPADWINLTTHRLDIYKEDQAKTEFIDSIERLYQNNTAERAKLENLPTAFDYIRLGHPLSSILEWALAKNLGLDPDSVISFSSRTMPLLAILRKNLFLNKKTQISYPAELEQLYDFESFKKVYGYDFVLNPVQDISEIQEFDGTRIYLSQENQIELDHLPKAVDFYLSIIPQLGSVIYVNGEKNKNYIAEIQHVRRRESIAMTPSNCHKALNNLVFPEKEIVKEAVSGKNLDKVRATIKQITGSNCPAIVGSSGLSIQYAIMMGLIDQAIEQYPGKKIQIIVPPNCYGGTNDQARRVAACLSQVEIVDLPVDGDNDMVQSTQLVLNRAAEQDAVPLIIAEIPTNPRVEVPNLEDLRRTLSHQRQTPSGSLAISPVFILDQTFCPNVPFVKEQGILSTIQTISYVSGSKFPSGGKCTAGYCVANKEAAFLMDKIQKHLAICDNEATAHQVEILAEQMPSMLQRIEDAYSNTREFVNFIKAELPSAKINFVSEELAAIGFTPSVFSLDLPTKGNSHEERESYKRALNLKLINMMIGEIPKESKYCVSYGQLNGCYWTIPATSTQGTTKESDKDYIARVSVSPDLDLEKHKAVFQDFVKEI